MGCYFWRTTWFIDSLRHGERCFCVWLVSCRGSERISTNSLGFGNPNFLLALLPRLLPAQGSVMEPTNQVLMELAIARARKEPWVSLGLPYSGRKGLLSIIWLRKT